MNFFVLVLVAIVITAVTGKLNEVVNYVVNWFKPDKVVKSSLAIAVLLGIASGLALQIGLVQSIFELFSSEVELNPLFAQYVDVGFTCVGLSAGAGFFVGIVEKYQSTSSEVVTN